MARLIVEVGGKARRFRLNEGTLSIGSGADATLTLESDELAEIHAELEFADGKAVLRMRKGVLPAVVRGRKVTGDVTLAAGVPVSFGGAKLTLEDDEAPPATPITRSRVTAGAGGGGASRAGVQRQRRTIQKSMPSWLIIVLVLAAVGIGYKLFEAYSADAVEQGFSVKASDYKIRAAIAEENFAGVFEQMELVDQQTDLDAQWKAKFEGYRQKAVQMQAEAAQMRHNVGGNKIWETQLKRFVDDRLSTASRPPARVFLKRLAEFRKEYPTHPKLEWCDRMERRYADVAALSEPPTFADVEFETKTLTWAMPRDYVQAFAILEEFIETATPDDRDKAIALLDEKASDRKEYFDDRMLQAAYLWERKQYGEAIEWLVQLVIKIGDEEMADDAARRIAASPGVDAALRGYQNDRPEVFARLMKNSIVRDFAEEQGIL